MSVCQAYSLFQLTGHAVGVSLPLCDIIDHLLPFILGGFGFKGIDNGVEKEAPVKLFIPSKHNNYNKVKQQRRNRVGVCQY